MSARDNLLKTAEDLNWPLTLVGGRMFAGERAWRQFVQGASPDTLQKLWDTRGQNRSALGLLGRGEDDGQDADEDGEE